MSEVLPADAQKAIISHMNKDHVGHMLLYCNKLKNLQEQFGDNVVKATNATMVSVDVKGFDVQATLELSDSTTREETIRFDFPREAEQRSDVRVMMVEMVKQVENQ